MKDLPVWYLASAAALGVHLLLTLLMVVKRMYSLIDRRVLDRTKLNR